MRLFQAQPIRRSAQSESSFDTAETRAHVRVPDRPAKRSASRARTGARIRGVLFALLILAGGSSATFLVLDWMHDALGPPLGLIPSGALSPRTAAELLARRAYPEALAAYRSLARAHPEQRHYAVIAELIEARGAAVADLPR